MLYSDCCGIRKCPNVSLSIFERLRNLIRRGDFFEMRTIEYLINEENQKIVLKNILNDWDINETEVSDTDKLKLLSYIEEKSKMVYFNLGESVISESNIDLYTDICLQPQNLLYTALPFQKNVSITISMNEVKAFVANVAFTLLDSQKTSLEKIQIVVIKLLVLLITCSSIISKDIEKCVLKSIIILLQNGAVTKEDIFSLFNEEYFCPNALKKCEYFNSNTGKCWLSKGKRNDLISCAFDSLIKKKVITIVSSEETDVKKFCISKFIAD